MYKPSNHLLHKVYGEAVLTSAHNLCFWAELKKLMDTPVNPSFTEQKRALRGQNCKGVFSWCDSPEKL